MNLYKEALENSADYYVPYIKKVGDIDIIKYLTKQLDELDDFFDDIQEANQEKPYAEGKWSIKEILGHIIDTERIFAYRVLRFVRGDETSLPGFDENAFTSAGKFNFCETEELLDEFHLVRQSNLALMRNLTPNEASRKGKANDQEMSVAALMYAMAGHVSHHLEVIRDKYLQPA